MGIPSEVSQNMKEYEMNIDCGANPLIIMAHFCSPAQTVRQPARLSILLRQLIMQSAWLSIDEHQFEQSYHMT